MMTYIRAWMSSKFGRIRPRTMELAAFERLKDIPYTYNGENDVIKFSPLFFTGSFSDLQVTRTHIRVWMSSKFDQIRPWTTSEKIRYTYNGENDVITFSSLFFHRILFIHAGNDDTLHKSLNEFEIRPDQTTYYGVSCP